MAAAYMRSVIYVLSSERNSLLTRGNGFIVESKRYVRGLRRTPVKVLYPDKETGKVVKQPEPEVNNVRKQKKKEPNVQPAAKHPGERDFIRSMSIEQSPVQSAYFAAAKDEVDGLRFERAFPGDKRLAKVVTVARSRTFREHQHKILLEGRRLICDALEAGANPQMVFFSSVDRLRELPLDKLKRATLVKVKFEDIKIWSELVAPQGVIAIFSRPDPSRLNFVNTSHSVPMTLICDNIRDPGNLGTILRCAAAAGCRDVLLTKGCVDAWEPKVLRGAMGAHFRLPVYPSLSWDDIQSRLPKPVIVHLADNSCGTSRKTEDANVNASSKLSEAGDYRRISARHNRSNMHYDMEDSSDSDSDSEDEGFSLPIVDSKLYHETWAQSPTALVVGGETYGLSVEAFQLAKKTAGQRLFIPIVSGVDSLNAAMAASILLFEGRKQLLRLIQTSAKKS